MVEIIKDERKINVDIEKDLVVFEFNNVQHYTKEQGRNVWFEMKSDLQFKTNQLKNLKENVGQIEIDLRAQFNKKADEMLKNYPEHLKEADVRHWVAFNTKIQLAEIDKQIKALTEDLGNIEEGLKVWAECEKLPETKHEKKIKEAVDAKMREMANNGKC